MITADAREPKDIINKLSLSTEVKIDLLSIGDYLLPNGYAFERKKGRDFMSSVMSKRLFEQLEHLSNYNNPHLVIISDNIWKDFYFSKSRYIHNQYLGTLTTLSLSYPKVKLVFLDSDTMFIKYLESLHKKLITEKDSERPTPLVRKAKSINMRRENALACAENVGISMAKKLLKRYKSIRDIADADIEDMLKIDKLGRKTAQNIKDLLN